MNDLQSVAASDFQKQKNVVDDFRKFSDDIESRSQDEFNFQSTEREAIYHFTQRPRLCRAAWAFLSTAIAICPLQRCKPEEAFKTCKKI